MLVGQVLPRRVGELQEESAMRWLEHEGRKEWKGQDDRNERHGQG